MLLHLLQIPTPVLLRLLQLAFYLPFKTENDTKNTILESDNFMQMLQPCKLSDIKGITIVDLLGVSLTHMLRLTCGEIKSAVDVIYNPRSVDRVKTPHCFRAFRVLKNAYEFSEWPVHYIDMKVVEILCNWLMLSTSAFPTEKELRERHKEKFDTVTNILHIRGICQKVFTVRTSRKDKYQYPRSTLSKQKGTIFQLVRFMLSEETVLPYMLCTLWNRENVDLLTAMPWAVPYLIWAMVG